MKLLLATAMILCAASMAPPAHAAGCVKGAVVGGILGHMAGHGAVGAAAGCAIGRHEANKAADNPDTRRDRFPNNNYQ